MKSRSAAITVAALACMYALVPTSASATQDSSTVTFDNGETLTSNAWIQPWTWGVCGRFQTSATMTASPQWIRNTTSFYQIGLGSISIKGVNIEDSRQDSATLSWTNDNGAKGSYLSGTVCGGWGMVYLGMDATATAFYNGNLRVANAHV